MGKPQESIKPFPEKPDHPHKKNPMPKSQAEPLLRVRIAPENKTRRELEK